MRSWLNKAGRGPTKLISPVKTLQNCGSSSWLDFRSNLPTQRQMAVNILQKMRGYLRHVFSHGSELRHFKNHVVLAHPR